MVVSDTQTKFFKVLGKKVLLYVVFISKKENVKPGSQNSLYTKSMISGMFDEGGMSAEIKKKEDVKKSMAQNDNTNGVS